MTTRWKVEQLAIGCRIIGGTDCPYIGTFNDTAIAAQIVREHNAHDALVEALDWALGMVRVHAPLQDLNIIFDNAQAALASAQEQKGSTS